MSHSVKLVVLTCMVFTISRLEYIYIYIYIYIEREREREREREDVKSQ